MQTNRCGHFSIEVEMLPVQHTAVVLRVPVRRCALAERMIAIIQKTEEGREVADQIQMLGSGTGAAGAASEIRAAFGPDLEPIHRPECTVTRCLESCTPGYRQMLNHFGHLEEMEQEMGKGCSEETAQAPDALAQN